MVLLPNAGGPSPLRHLTALYASWYGLTLQKPNVSGPPYGFTAPRPWCYSPRGWAGSLTAPYGTLRFTVRMATPKAQCFRASLRIYGSQTPGATPLPGFLQFPRL